MIKIDPGTVAFIIFISGAGIFYIIGTIKLKIKHKKELAELLREAEKRDDEFWEEQQRRLGIEIPKKDEENNK